MPSSAFIHRGVSRVYFTGAIATPAVPTRAEINAGINLTPSIAAVGGFAVDNQLVNISPVGALFVEQRQGVRKVTGPCTLTLYDNQASPTIRSTWMAVGNSGFLIFLPYGDVTGRRCEVWPTLTASVADTWADLAAVYRVLFAVSAAPTQNATVP